MPNHLFDTVVEFEKTDFHEPVVFGGFVGPGLVGLVCAGYMIEKLNLHEIAHVRSQHIPPVAVFVGAKLRHPFRIYSDDSGKTVVMICEMPIDIEGLYEISLVLLDWIEGIRAREIVILDGVGVSGIPDQRVAYSVANESRMKELEQKGITAIQTAMIGGIGGALLNQSLTRRISGVSLLTTASIELPDPGAALTLIKSINQIYGLGIPTADLEQNVERLNERLNALADQYRKLNDQLPESDKRPYA
ncbi:MAG: PAC2 family protein [Thaumarchaeota archaeon]|nr:PAC2 family protein [Nitrososphaerota archaeon]